MKSSKHARTTGKIEANFRLKRLRIVSTILFVGILSLLSACIHPQTAHAALPAGTYYFAASGNDDRGKGTFKRPWRTIAKLNALAAQGLSPGTTLALKGGETFGGNISIESSGQAGRFITLTSYGAGRATIAAGDGFGIRLHNCQFIRVRNLIFVGSGKISQLHVNPDTSTWSNPEKGIDIYSDATVGERRQSIHVDNCNVSGFHDAIVAHTPVGKGAPVVGFNDVRVTRCVLHDCLVGGFWCWGSKDDSSAPWKFPTGNMTFTNCYVGRCTIYNIFGDPIANLIVALPIQVFNSTGFMVERCTIYDCGQFGSSTATQGGLGGLVFLECTRCVAQHCEIYRMVTHIRYDGCGFDLDGGVTDSVLQYNYSHDNEGAGYQTGTFQGSTATSGNVIRYNISENDGRKNSSGSLMTWGGNGALMHNNTIYAAARADAAQPAICLRVVGGSAMHIVNNVFYADAPGTLLAEITVGADNATLRGNAYWARESPFLIRSVGDPAPTYDSLAAWRAATGQEQITTPAGVTATGIQLDPMLRRPGGGGSINNTHALGSLTAYDPQPGSPLLRAAVEVAPLSSVSIKGSTDYHGMPLPPTGALDVGASQKSNAQTTRRP